MTEKLVYQQYLEAELTRQEENLVENLVISIGILQNKMTRLTEKLTEGGNFNSLGEIQGLASEIDRITGEVATVRQIKNRIKGMLNEAELLNKVFGEGGEK